MKQNQILSYSFLGTYTITTKKNFIQKKVLKKNSLLEFSIGELKIQREGWTG